jgi:citrate lyase subunit beta / citryl-CoA lyase
MDNQARIIRTMGFAPGHDHEAILAAAEAGLDAVGADLEDLTPRSEKASARERFVEVARELHARGTIVMARTNDLGAGAEEDIEAIVCEELHCLNVPKARSAEQVIEFCRLIEQAERNNGVPVGHTLVRPVVETAEGIRNAYEVAAASPRVTYMGGVAGSFWGDLGATLGSIIGPDGDESHYLRSKVVVDVRCAGVRFPIGGGSIANTDAESIRTFAWRNKRLGYTGMYTVANPDTIELIHEVFTPTAEEIAEWTHVVPLVEQAERDGTVCVRIDGTLYDTAGLTRVRDLLDLARRLDLLTV